MHCARAGRLEQGAAVIGRGWKNEAPDLEGIAERAREYADQWREDCYVYARPGLTIYSQGPDAEHPKTLPTLVVKYEAPAKKGGTNHGRSEVR